MRSLPLADPGVPDLRSGRRFLAWIARNQAGPLAIATVFGVAWMGAQAVLPFALGRALDEGIAGEDRSRVRNRNAALNLAVLRRAVVSVAVRWIRRCKNKRQATMSGFYDFMSAKNSKTALKLVTLSKPSWLLDS